MSSLIDSPTALERFTFAPMEERHLEDVVSVERMSYTNPWPRDAFVHEIEVNPFSRPTVAISAASSDASGELAGYCVFWVMFEHLHIQNIAVHPRHRRAGLARAFLIRALDEGRSRSADNAFLEVRRSNLIAQKLYTSVGFELAGERKNYYSRPREDALLFRTDLRHSGTR